MQTSAFAAHFRRDDRNMTITVFGRYTAADLPAFQADTHVASRGRQREWTVNADGLDDGSEAFAEALVWLRTLGHVCLLNPTPALLRATEEADAHQAIVIRSDSRARR